MPCLDAALLPFALLNSQPNMEVKMRALLLSSRYLWL